jgi:hypothetical protein
MIEQLYSIVKYNNYVVRDIRRNKTLATFSYDLPNPEKSICDYLIGLGVKKAAQVAMTNLQMTEQKKIKKTLTEMLE